MIQPEECFNFIKIKPIENTSSLKHDLNDSVTFEVRIDESLPYFNGHFPEMPILPAVAYIDISKIIATKIMKKNHQDIYIRKIKKAKFLRPIEINENLLIKVIKNQDNWHFQFLTNKANSPVALLDMELNPLI